MAYYFSKILMFSFEDTISNVTEELKKEVFGILTDIAVQTWRYRSSGAVETEKSNRRFVNAAWSVI